MRARPLISLALLMLAGRVWAGEAQALLDEQLALLHNPDIASTVRVLTRLGKFSLVEHEETTPAPTPSDEQKRAGYIVFGRSYLEETYYNSNPRPREIGTELRLFATPGEYEPVTFAVKPLAPLSGATVTCTELKSAKGVTIPREAVDVRFVRQLARGVKSFVWMPGPEALEEFAKVDIPQGRTTQFWLTVHVPPTATPGQYAGTVTFQAGNAPATPLALTVVVLPFRLLEDPETQFGWYYGSSSAATLDAELDDMRAHGFNAITLPSPTVTRIAAEGEPEIDLSAWEKYADLLREMGMTGIHQAGVDHVTSAILRAGIPELSPQFSGPFIAAMRQHKEWLDAHPDFRVAFTIYDEPRESLLNPWNRNFEQTAAYIKLCRQVPGLVISVNPMGDSGGSVDYTPFAGLVDVLNTHAWKGSAKLISETLRLDKTLWVYNNGYSRLAWGFSLWKLGARGNWQWAYFGAGSSDPYSPIPVGGSENPGESNTGRGPTYCFPDRIIPTPRYEWVREGIDDYRYLYTLREELREVGGKAAKVRAEADALLDEIAQVAPMYPATGLQTGAEAGSSGDPAQLLAYYDHFRWRAALCLVKLEDVAAGRNPEAAGSLYAQYAKFPFGAMLPAGG
ncbi:MAG: hypothetical protein FJX75_18155 [Armatimonadetes bacterium]|nr:hypothetical protein [Armatimonadota bacterium]